MVMMSQRFNRASQKWALTADVLMEFMESGLKVP
jgi:hypothetical protein